MGVKVIGLEKATAKLSQFGDRTTRASRRQIEIEALAIRDLAREQAPEMTGALSHSIEATKETDDRRRKVMVVSFEAENAETGFDYGLFMHEGQYDLGPASRAKQAANGKKVGPRFLARAAKTIGKGLVDRMKAALAKK